MIINQELRLWANSPEKQQQMRASADDFARQWDGGPGTLLSKAFSGLPDDADAIIRASRALFENSQWVDQLVDALVAEMSRDPYFIPPLIASGGEIQQGLQVYENERVAISIGIYSCTKIAAKKVAARGEGSIVFGGQATVVKFVKSGDALLSFWEAPPITEEFAAATAGQCRKTGERRIKDGEVLVMDGRFQSYGVEHSRRNFLVLQAAIKAEQAPLLVEYDAGSHFYAGCSATDDAASRIQMVSTLLRKLGHEEAFPVLAALLDHPAFFVRWHIMRELIGIDPAAALPHLERLAGTDPHPDIRRAAGDLLERFAPPVEERKAEPCLA